MRNPSTMTTRTATARRASRARREDLLADGAIVRSPETGLEYRIDHAIGAGGFGQAYFA